MNIKIEDTVCKMKKLSLKEVAKSLKVSPSTVSRALSGKPGVSQQKREEIIEKARKLGFTPDSMASSLKTGKTYGVTVIVGQQGSEITLNRNHMIFDLARKKFGSIRVASLNEDNDLDKLIWDAAAGRSKAIIATVPQKKIDAETARLLKKRKIPLTSVDFKLESFDSAQIDRSAGTFQAARMLYLCGCKTPIFMSSQPIEKPDPRLEGILKAARSLDKTISQEDIHVINGSDYQDGFKYAKALLNSRFFDGLFCYCDRIAIGAMRAIIQAGLRIPEDIKIIGFDNIPAAEFLPISLTTVAQPESGPAQMAVELTLDRLENFDRDAKDQIFPTSLIARESCPLPEDFSMKEKIFATQIYIK